jgi:hypothetical protein
LPDLYISPSRAIYWGFFIGSGIVRIFGLAVSTTHVEARATQRKF